MVRAIAPTSTAAERRTSQLTVQAASAPHTHLDWLGGVLQAHAGSGSRLRGRVARARMVSGGERNVVHLWNRHKNKGPASLQALGLNGWETRIRT